jgi:sec-independent protein translocase protein TatB
MFDISWQELFLIAIVALLVIPPKDLPRAMAVAGRWMRRAKSMARDFHTAVDELAREAELHELRQKADEAARKVTQPLTIDNMMQPLGAKPDKVEPHE